MSIKVELFFTSKKVTFYMIKHAYIFIVKCRIKYCLMVLLSCCVFTQAQNKRALLVGLSHYGKATGWNDIHGTNDIDLIKTKLKGFSIKELRNSSATYDNIISELRSLERESKEGDTIYIHLSGHGQPVEDYNGDELDGWDESFIPFDAHMIYNKLTYDGSKHLTDDILHKHYELLQKRLGSKGVLIVVIDACHSGESYRGEDDFSDFFLFDEEICDSSIIESAISEIDDYEYFERGTALGFSKNKKEYTVKKNTAKNRVIIKRQRASSTILLLESCLSSQKSMEIDILLKDRQGRTRHYFCGPLSYSIYKTICKKNYISTNMDWVKCLNDTFSQIMYRRGKQQLVIEYTE